MVDVEHRYYIGCDDCDKHDYNEDDYYTSYVKAQGFAMYHRVQTRHDVDIMLETHPSDDELHPR